MILTFCTQKADLHKFDPWTGILGAFIFATNVRTTVHSTNRATPAQLVFAHDAILNILHEANWGKIKEQTEKTSLTNSIQEKKTQKKHEYKILDKVF